MMSSLPTIVGLVLALGGPALLASRRPANEEATGPQLADQVRLLALTIAVIAMVYWERRPLASLGWQGFAWASLAWGCLLAFVFVRIVLPLETRLLVRLKLAGFAGRLARLSRLPPGVLIIVALVAGIADETLLRGYAFTRIADLTGSEMLAGLIVVGIFALAHLRLWGWGAVATVAINGGVLTAFFAWRHDLLANIAAHALADAIGLFEAAVRTRRSQPG